MRRRPFKPASEGGRRPMPSPKSHPELVRIFGYHAVRAALASPARQPVRLYATQAAADRLGPDIVARGVPLAVVSPEDISRRLGGEAVHQGVLLEARPLAPVLLDDLPDDGFVLALDRVTDPHNVGAILRTAAAFGLDGAITTERHSPAIEGTLAKSASGALEFVPVVCVVNLARALDELGDRGFLRIGLDSDGPTPFGEIHLSRPLVLVLGAEGKGLRRLTRERCDALARLDLPGPIKSLNVSTACASALTLASIRLAPRQQTPR